MQCKHIEYMLMTNMTVWPSGLRRWLKAPFRKGVGSNPTAVNGPGWCCLRPPMALPWSPAPQSEAASMKVKFTAATKQGGSQAAPASTYIASVAIAHLHDSLAERSKAVAQGAIL